MYKPKGQRGRDPVKRDEMLCYIRGQVQSGVWGVGAKLPSRKWFEKTFAASPTTVQQTFERLHAERVLESEPRKGTRVSLCPPHLTRYGLVLYGSKKLENIFSRTIVRAAEILRRERGLNLQIYFDLDCRIDEPDHLELLYGVENQLFAGLFFASAPKNLLGSPIVEKEGIPRVFMSSAGEKLKGVEVDINHPLLEYRTIQYLAEAGARRIAILQPASGPNPARKSRLLQLADSFGLELARDHYLELHSSAPCFVPPVVEMMFHRRNRECPDGLFIGDDNFLPYALEGLERALGSEAARQVKVVSHANYPQENKPDFPVKFFYINVLALLERAIGIIDALRAGRTPDVSPLEIYDESQLKERVLS